MPAEFILGILVAIFISFIVFLILRELMCWYWKINTAISILENIQHNIQLLASAKMGKDNVFSQESDTSKEICPFCKEPSLKANHICEICGKNKR